MQQAVAGVGLALTKLNQYSERIPLRVVKRGTLNLGTKLTHFKSAPATTTTCVAVKRDVRKFWSLLCPFKSGMCCFEALLFTV